jgi:hypothetical protein
VSGSRETFEALQGLRRSCGDLARTLGVGPWAIVVEGLDATQAAELDRRWGSFVRDGATASPSATVRVLAAEGEVTLESSKRDKFLRLEGQSLPGGILVRSYDFALCPDQSSPGTWLAGFAPTTSEPAGRILENVIRYLIARLAVEAGGFALHAAGLLRQGRAYVFAGASRAGKTTVVGLSAHSPSLGDDYAVLLPAEPGWIVAPVPFDNREVSPTDRPRETLPAAGVWRLFQAGAPKVETPSVGKAVASLMACVPSPWAMPDLAGRLLENVQAFVAESRFAHLHFRLDPDFWDLIN